MQKLDKVTTCFIEGNTISGNAGAMLQIVTGTIRTIKMAQVFNTSGRFLGIYVGPSGQEVLEFVVGPGSEQDTYISIPEGSRITIRSLEASAPTSGYVGINFLG